MSSADALSGFEMQKWAKPSEWDTSMDRTAVFLSLGPALLKPSLPCEKFWYTPNPPKPLIVPAPPVEDIDPRADPSPKKVQTYANCPDALRSVIPRYYGPRDVGKQGEFLAMENLMGGMRNPCYFDIKIGTRTYDPFAWTAKVDRKIKKVPLRTVYGFRVTGMRLWKKVPSADGPDTLVVDKNPAKWGRSLTDWDSGVKGDFVTRFVSLMTDKQKAIILSKLAHLDKIWTTVGSKEVLIFGPSLYCAYEAASTLGNGSMDRLDGETFKFDPNLLRIKIIDFGHAFWRRVHPKVEDGVLQGIRNVRRAFMSVLTGSTGDLGEGPKPE